VVTTNFAADRGAAEAILAVMPEGRRVARENRSFLRRVVRHLTAEVGIRQFVDGRTLVMEPSCYQTVTHAAGTSRPRVAC
jgi:hypothetical protein